MNAIRSANWAKVDPGRAEAFQRTLDVSGAGSVLLQTTISRVVQFLTLRELGVTSTLPRRPGSGDKFYSQRRSAANTGAAWVNDTEEPVTSEGDYTQVGYEYKTLLARATVSRKLIARGRSYGDVLATELAGKADDYRQELEEASVIGDSASNTKQIDGLLTLIGSVSGQTIANTTATAGDGVYLDKLDATFQQVKGGGNAELLRVYVSKKGARLINAALQAQQRFNDRMIIDGGFQVLSYNGAPVVITTSMPDDMVWNGTDAAITAFTGGDTTAAVVVNTEYVFYSELTPLRVMPLGRTTSQWEAVDMYSDLTLVLDHDFGGAILGGLA